MGNEYVFALSHGADKDYKEAHEHEDSEPEIVDLAFQIPQSGMAIVSNEYRNKDVRKSKAVQVTEKASY